MPGGAGYKYPMPVMNLCYFGATLYKLEVRGMSINIPIVYYHS